MLCYRELLPEEAEKIREIDGECYIKRSWREVGGVRRLVTIDWTDHELPNGLSWHIAHFRESLQKGGRAIGCFDGETLVGYAVVNAELFGKSANYVLLDQVFVSKEYRGKGVGKELFSRCCAFARGFSADKLYICAGSSEDTVAFYFRLGCTEAAEIDEELYALDKNDYQLEYLLHP